MQDTDCSHVYQVCNTWYHTSGEDIRTYQVRTLKYPRVYKREITNELNKSHYTVHGVLQVTYVAKKKTTTKSEVRHNQQLFEELAQLSAKPLTLSRKKTGPVVRLSFLPGRYILIYFLNRRALVPAGLRADVLRREIYTCVQHTTCASCSAHHNYFLIDLKHPGQEPANQRGRSCGSSR